MVDDDAVDRLLRYVKSLKDFEMADSVVPYGHMGATIVDGVLQAGMKYETVESRVKSIARNPVARTTSGFLRLLVKEGAENLLDWRGVKLDRIADVTMLLFHEGVETETELNRWLQKPSNFRKLQRIKGIGEGKTADYFKILAGVQEIAVDTHLSEFLKKAGIEASSYTQAREIIGTLAERLDIGKGLLDHSIWKYERDHK